MCCAPNYVKTTIAGFVKSRRTKRTCARTVELSQTDATMKISMCARVMIFFQPLLLVNFVFDRNETYAAKSCLRCTVHPEIGIGIQSPRYLNSILKRVTVVATT